MTFIDAITMIVVFIGGFWLRKRLEQSISHEYDQKLVSIQHEYNQLLESVRLKNSLRMAALKERLQAHQEAFSLWRKLNASLSDKDARENLVVKCDEWWNHNCLYLEPEARQAFLSAFIHAKDIDFYKSSQDCEDLVSESYRIINQAGSSIEKCVELPELNEVEIINNRRKY